MAWIGRRIGGVTATGDASWPIVEGYQVLSEIGRGGFASVYEAVQESVDRRVALKVLAASAAEPEMERRFRSECRTIGELSWHPHVVALFDAGLSIDGRPYMAMELLPEGSLASKIKTNGPLPTNVVIQIGIEIADALSAAHEAGVIHRDVKPANILVGRRGEHLLGDFGIATITDATRSTTGSFSGTYAYCAPEVHHGLRAAPASDVFSLGASLYTLSSGQPAFMNRTDDPPSAVILRVVSEAAPPLPPSVPPQLVAVIDKAMAKEPSDRQRSAAELRDALQEAARAPSSDRSSDAITIEDPLVTRQHVNPLNAARQAARIRPTCGGCRNVSWTRAKPAWPCT